MQKIPSLRTFTSIIADPLWKSTALDQKPITEASTDTVPVLATFLLKRGSSFASYTTHSYRSLRLRNISTVFINISHSRFRLLWLVTILPLILTLTIFGKCENSCLGTRLVAQKWTSAFFSIGIILHIILSIIQQLLNILFFSLTIYCNHCTGWYSSCRILRFTTINALMVFLFGINNLH